MIASHGIFTAHGFWLPNDPRGSWSDWVAAWDLYCVGGKATKVGVKQSVTGVRHDVASQLATKQSLKRAAVNYSGIQARAVGRGIANAVAKSGHIILACAILPDHAHVVVGASKYRPRTVIGHFKREASIQLIVEELHPFQQLRQRSRIPSCWAKGCWCVYLDRDADVQRAVKYVKGNPAKEGKRPQRWSFVTPPN